MSAQSLAIRGGACGLAVALYAWGVVAFATWTVTIAYCLLAMTLVFGPLIVLANPRSAPFWRGFTATGWAYFAFVWSMSGGLGLPANALHRVLDQHFGAGNWGSTDDMWFHSRITSAWQIGFTALVAYVGGTAMTFVRGTSGPLTTGRP